MGLIYFSGFNLRPNFMTKLFAFRNPIQDYEKLFLKNYVCAVTIIHLFFY